MALTPKRLVCVCLVQSWTPSDEEHYLARRLGVAEPAAAAVKEQGLHAAAVTVPSQAAAMPAVAVAGGRRPSPEEAVRQSPYNVPYFSTALHPVPEYARYGMHAAAATYKDALRDQGVVLDNGHYLDAHQDKELAEELDGSQMQYASQEEANPDARPRSKPLRTEAERALADDLVAGQRYAYLPNHGEADASAPKAISPAQGAALQSQLEAGLRYANVGAWHKEAAAAVPVSRALSRKEGKQLADQLEGGIEYAELPNHGKPVLAAAHKYDTSAEKALVDSLVAGQKYAELPNHGMPVLTAEQRGLYNLSKERALVKSLTQGEVSADLGTTGATASSSRSHHLKAVPGGIQGQVLSAQKLERRVWGVPETKAVHELSSQQAHNLHKYLKQGIRQVFGSRHVPAPKYVGAAEASKLYKGYEQGEAEEAKVGAVKKERFITEADAVKMSRSMKQSIEQYQSGGGAYMGEYLRQVEGSKFKGAGEARAVAERSARKQRQEAKGKELGKELSEGIKFVKGAEKAAKAKSAKAPHMLNDKDGRSLAEYLQPQRKLVKGQAPGLGFAV